MPPNSRTGVEIPDHGHVRVGRRAEALEQRLGGGQQGDVNNGSERRDGSCPANRSPSRNARACLPPNAAPRRSCPRHRGHGEGTPKPCGGRHCSPVLRPCVPSPWRRRSWGRIALPSTVQVESSSTAVSYRPTMVPSGPLIR